MPVGPADNVFVKILNGEIPSTEVWSNDKVYCFLDLFPQNPGHTLVVPRNYSANYLEATESDIAECWAAIRKLVPAIQSATAAKGVSVQSNKGRDAGQLIEYLHFHIIPRHPGDHVSMYELGPQQTPEQLSEMASRIKHYLAG